MCGIIGFVSQNPKRNPAQFLVDGLKRLEYRGYDSWGIAFGEAPTIFKKAGKISDFSPNHLSLITYHYPASAGLGHTRWATHGGVTDENAHPHLDCTGQVVVVHNGIIENWEELRNELRGKGHEFRSETDTEVVPHLIEDQISNIKDQKGSLVEVVRQVFNQLEGLNAIAVFFPKESLIVAFRNGSPLVVGVGESEFYLASDIPAFLPYTKQVVFLDDGEGVVLANIKNLRQRRIRLGRKKPKIKIVNAKTGEERKPKVEEINWSVEEAEKGEYPHFLIKEIREQPAILTRLAKYPERDLQEVADLIKNSFGTYFTACGTAAHAGLGATYLFSKIAKRHVNFAVGSEFYFLKEFLTPKSLLVAASQSGETMDTLEAVRAAKQHQAKVIALTNVPGSSITRLVDKTLMLNCGPEKAVLATKSYTAKLAVFLLLAYQMVGRLSEGRKLISKTAEGISDLFSRNSERQIKALAKRLKNVEHIYTIGRGVNYPTALEAALKIKEVSYIHAEGFAGGELKHGVIALIEGGPPRVGERRESRRGTPCLVFVANDETRASVLSNAQELKSRGGFIIGISPEGSETFDEWIKVPDVGAASPIVNVIPAQLLAYFLAVERGLDPDKPRNLAKSVTVK